jgi:hypothetical protein
MADRGQFLTGERAIDEFHARRTVLRKVGAQITAQNTERQMGSARGIPRRHTRVLMLIDFERLRPAFFDRFAKPMQRADARIAAP